MPHKGSVVLATVLATTCLGSSGHAGEVAPSYRPFDISIFPPVNVFHPARKVIVGPSINVLYGRAWSVYGVEVGAGVNREDSDVGGVQLAGIVNIVDGFAYGVQVSAVWNEADRGCGPICLAGLYNTHGHVVGLQAAPFNSAKMLDGLQVGVHNNADNAHGLVVGLWNYLQRDATELEIGLFNSNNWSLVSMTDEEVTHRLTSGTTSGLQIALFNSAYSMDGIMIGALFNRTHATMRGLQLAVIGNNAKNDAEAGAVHGVQLAAANLADEVDGLQVGLLNVTRELHGVQLGLLNIATDNPLPFMVGLNVGF